MSEVGSVKRAYVLAQVAVLVFGWYEADPAEPEHGVRIEVRRLGHTAQRGSESAAQVVVIDEPLFRADLFDLIAQDEAGNFLRAHYHPAFDGVEPVDRHWDPDLSNDPFGWLARQLSDLEAIAAAAGAMSGVAALDPDVLASDAATLRQLAAEVVAAAQIVLAQVRASR